MASNSQSAKTKQLTRLFTGIETLDKMIGGIPNGSVIILTGELGSGFDIFAQQVLYTSASTGNCNALYATVDRPPDEIENEVAGRGWNISGLMADKKWEFLDAYTVRMNIRKGVTGAKYLRDMFSGIPSLIKVGTWSTVDTLTYLVEGMEYKEVEEVLDQLMLAAREKGGLHFLMLVEGLQDKRLVTSIAHTADGLFNFSLDPQQTEAYGTIRIIKLRKSPQVTRLIPYRLTEKGIAIETVTRIG